MTKSASNREIFGQITSGENTGQSVYRVKLTGGGLTANIITWGASVQDLRLEGHSLPLVLGFDNFAAYESHGLYFGATVGRFANRISGASFTLDGAVHKTNANDGPNTLHGGVKRYSNRNWQIADLGTSHVYLTLDDPDGHMGFPGDAHISCCYTLQDNGVLHIAYSTRSVSPTIAGLAHHSYFNLDGSADCRDHFLQIQAHAYLPVDDACLPTGSIDHLADGPFDFRQPRRINAAPSDDGMFDHNYCLAERRRGKQEVALLQSSISNVQMSIATTEPGLQFYTGRGIQTEQPGLMGQPYGPFSGLCLETQNWPDAPNHDHFPSAVVLPGETLRQVTEYRFSKSR